MTVNREARGVSRDLREGDSVWLQNYGEGDK